MTNDIHNLNAESRLQEQWARQDSNLRRHKPSDLQSDVCTAENVATATVCITPEIARQHVSQREGGAA